MKCKFHIITETHENQSDRSAIDFLRKETLKSKREMVKPE